MGAVGQLFVELKATVDPFISDMKRAQKEADETTKYLKPMKTTATEVGTAFVAVGGAVVGALGAATLATANYGDELTQMSMRTGESTENLSRLRFAAQQSDVDVASLAKGLNVLTKNANLAADGNKKSADAFKDLGIKVLGADGQLRPMSSLLLDVADKFSKMEDGTEKAAAAQEIFGKSGAELIPLLDEGRAGIERLGDQAQRLGLVMGTEAALAGDVFNDTLDELKGSVQGVAIQVGTVFMPMLTDLAHIVTDVVVEFRSFAAEHAEVTKAIGLAAVALTGAGGLLLGFAGVLTILPKINAALELLGTGVTKLGGAMGVLSGVVIVALIASLVKLYSSYQDVIEAEKNLAIAQAGEQASANKAVAALREHGIVVNLAGKSEDERNRIIAEAGKQLVKQTDAQKLGTTALRVHVDKVAEAKSKEDAHKASIEQKKLAMDAMRFSLDMVTNAEKNYIDNLKLSTTHTWAMDEATLKLAGDMAGKAASDLRSFQDIIAGVATSWDSERYASERAQKDFDSLMNKMPTVEVGALGTNVLQTRDNFDKMTAAAKANADALKAATEDVKNAAGGVFDAMFIKGENVFTSLNNMLKGGLLSLGKSIFEDVTGALLGPVKKAFDDFFTALLESTGIKALVTGLGNKIGGAISGALGGAGGAASAAGTVASTVPGATSSGAEAMASAASSLTGAITAISGVVSAISSIIQNFQLARLEGTMNAVEANTRFLNIEVKDMMDNHLSQLVFWTTYNANQIHEQINQLDAIYNRLGDSQGPHAQVGGFGTSGGSGGGGGSSSPDSGELASLLRAILEVLKDGKSFALDGYNVARLLAPHFYRGTRDENWQLLGAR